MSIVEPEVLAVEDLRQQIEFFAADQDGGTSPEARQAFDMLLDKLERGEVRAATPGAGGVWEIHPWVKQGLLLGFRLGVLIEGGAGPLYFSDKDTFPPQWFSVERNVRIVPGGSSVRRGAHLGRGVTCMPPMYVNTGAYVGAGTMIDSHALVGSCAQVGMRVHVSAAAQIGGVLEPIGARPVIVEDEVFVGGNTGIYEGTLVRHRAVIGAGVVLTRSTPVYDVVNGTVLRGSADTPLEIPAGAVVLPGSRTLSGDFAREHGLSLTCAVIVKYRDAKTDAATALESSLR